MAGNGRGVEHGHVCTALYICTAHAGHEDELIQDITMSSYQYEVMQDMAPPRAPLCSLAAPNAFVECGG
jgi:hypothetical protein